MQPHLKPGMLFVSATKGLEEKTLLRMTEVVVEVVGSANKASKNGFSRASARSVAVFRQSCPR
jgi:glycerol-3-phosphate dehydrogenase